MQIDSLGAQYLRPVNGAGIPGSQISADTISSFGDEWMKFQYHDEKDAATAGEEYFDLLDLKSLPEDTVAAEIGCGTGRWVRMVAPHVKLIFGVEPSAAIEVAKKNCRNLDNFIPVLALAENLPFKDDSLDLVVCLGVLHHVHDTEKCLSEIFRVLKPSGKFLFYLYYALDNRPYLYRTTFKAVDKLRHIIARMPNKPKNVICDFIALTVYLPMVSLSKALNSIRLSHLTKNIPLSYYSNKNFYVMRTDARDRFGTPLEKRYSKDQLHAILGSAGFSRVNFSRNAPYWHGIAEKI